MGSVCSTLGAAYSAIGGWLSAALNWALSGVKWLWEKVSSLFKTAIDFLNNLFSNFCGWFRYSRQRTYVESNGSRVEVGHEDLSIGVEVNGNRAPQVLQEDLGEYLRNNVDVQQRERLTLTRKLIDELDDAMNNDENHESMPESERKLGDFLQSPEMQRLQELNGMDAINPGLA